MSFLYFLVTSSKAYADKLGVYKEYFVNNGGFTSAFLIALGVAFAVALIYYVACRMSFSWARMSTWVVTLFVAGAISFGVTGFATGISARTGALPQTVERMYKKKVSVPGADKTVLDKTKQDIRREQNKGMFGCNPVNRLCWTNFVLTIIFFYLFSLLFNGFSGHGVNIPHRGVFRF